MILSADKKIRGRLHNLSSHTGTHETHIRTTAASLSKPVRGASQRSVLRTIGTVPSGALVTGMVTVNWVERQLHNSALRWSHSSCTPQVVEPANTPCSMKVVDRSSRLTLSTLQQHGTRVGCTVRQKTRVVECAGAAQSCHHGSPRLVLQPLGVEMLLLWKSTFAGRTAAHVAHS